MASTIVGFTLNGRAVEVIAKPLVTLQTVLRDQLGFKATKTGCKTGGCGSCTVLLNGEPVLSCLLPVHDVEGQEIITLEGLTPAEGLHQLQAAFYEDYAIQCGYCTPGMIMVTKALLDRNPNPTREEIIDAISGNHCRCTGYEPIITAVQDAAQRLQTE